MKKKKLALALTTLSLIFYAVFISFPNVVYAEGTVVNGTEENCTHEASVGSTHYDTLAEAISSANGQEIQLLKSITLTAPIVIDKDTVINGANGSSVFQISGNINTNSYKRQGLFHMFNEADSKASLTLKNIALVNKNWSNSTGISVRASKQTLNLENVNIDTGYYSIFVGVPGGENEDVNDVTINIENSNIIGYAAIYYRTNSITNMIMRPTLNVNNSELTGRGYNGNGNGFSTIVYNGTRDARAKISNSTLSNSFNASNADASEGIIQFNCYGAYEEGAEITLSHSKIKTRSTTAAPNVIKYTAGENLNVGNKVIIDDLTILVDENESDLIRVMRNGNELVATGKELDEVLLLTVPNYYDKPNATVTSGDQYSSLLTSGDTVYVNVNTILNADAVVPENVTVDISKDAKLSIAEGIKLTGTKGSKLNIEGTVDGMKTGYYVWEENSWQLMVNNITLDKNILTLEKDGTAKLNATVQPSDATNKDVTWTSSNNKIASVDNTGKVTAAATGTATITATAGDKSATCAVTVYKTETPDITTPTTPTTGNEQATVAVDKESAAVITDSIKDVVTNVETTTSISAETKEALKTAIADGKTISVKPEVKAISESKVDKETLTKIEEKLGTKEEVAQYFELSMMLTADGEPLGKLNELTGKVSFTVTIDKSLIKAGRAFYMVRVHEDGSVEKIEGTLKGDQFTFETDKFSTFALVYDDTKVEAKVDTGDTTNATALITLMGMSILAAGAILLARRKTNQ